MPLATLWESICRLAGSDGSAAVRLTDAVEKSAVPLLVAEVEVRRMVEDGLMEGENDSLRLTERGRKACSELNHSPKAESGVTIAPDIELE